VVTFALLKAHQRSGKIEFSDADIKAEYEAGVKSLQAFQGHDVHIGAKYYDAYGNRMSRYSVLRAVGHLRYELQRPYTDFAGELCEWIPARIRDHIANRLGVVPALGEAAQRVAFAECREDFIAMVSAQIDKTPTNFEIFCFAVIKVHLEKFACRIYRDTRTSAHDRGVDLSTNYGVVYQIKKLRIHTELEADKLYSEIQANFDTQRIQDGNIILVIDDISKSVKQYLVDMKIQSLSKADLIALARNFDDPEDRQKVLRVVYEEFRREYSSSIK
jgi:hypothetical protein